MAQKLILPVNKAVVTASIKTEAYKKDWNFVHYGLDMVSAAGNTTVYACGNGEVIKTGLDSMVGNTVVVKYHDAYNHKTGKSADLIVRIFHMASIAVKDGQKVNKDTVLGRYGSTGKYTSGAHLHMEVDTDTKHPFGTPSVGAGKTNIYYGTGYQANDKTMSNPTEWLHCKASAPDNQTWATRNNSYIRDEDKSIPMIL